MRDRFSELIAAGVASFEEREVGTPTPCLDPIVKTYNNLWGLLTDTHMSKIDAGYIITGTFIDSPYWDRFFYACNWGSTCFKLGSGFPSLESMINAYGYRVQREVYNGDSALRLVPVEVDDDTKPDSGTAVPGCVMCNPICPVVVTTAESEIPHPFKEFFTEEQSKDIANAWSDAEGKAEKIIENLKSSRTINADIFRLSADGQYMLVDEKIKIKL